MRDISTLIFDYDGVFVLDEYRGIRHLCPDENALEKLEQPYYLTATCEEFWNDIRRHFYCTVSDAELAQAYNFEDDFQTAHKKEMFEMISLLSHKYEVILLTNQIEARATHIRKNENFSCFSSVFFSNEIGRAKPDREIFEYVLRKTRKSPSECLFIDDAPENIEVASLLGIQTFLYANQPTTEIVKIITEP